MNNSQETENAHNNENKPNKNYRYNKDFAANQSQKESADVLKEAFHYLMEHIRFKSYLCHNTVKERIRSNIPYALELQESKIDFERMSKFDKFFVVTESLSVLKEKEILRLIKKFRNKHNISAKQVHPKRTLSCYFGSNLSEKISNSFKINN